MFRAYDYDNADEKISDRRLNCLEWQQLTSVSISLEEIEKIVYQMPYEEFEELCQIPHLDGYYRTTVLAYVIDASLCCCRSFYGLVRAEIMVCADFEYRADYRMAIQIECVFLIV
jgi:hypothetical protein